MYLDGQVVKFEHPIRKFGFSKTGSRFYSIDDLAVDLYGCEDSVKISIAPTPEIQACDLLRSGDSRGFVRRERALSATERRDLSSVCIGDGYIIFKCFSDRI